MVDISSFFTLKGQLIIIALVQLGGIGIISFATFFASFMTKGIGLKHQSIIKDFLSSESLLESKKLLRGIIIITLFIELVGAILIFFSLKELKFNSIQEHIFYSIFHSISAFCNAGFSLFKDGLYTYKDNMPIRTLYSLHYAIAILIIIGGIGFSTLEDILRVSFYKTLFNKPWRKWKLSTQINIYTTIGLILIGFIVFGISELDNLPIHSIKKRLSLSLFQSITLRTAGFNTIDFGVLKDSTIIVCIFLMFIGGCPGSTAGGIKTSTFFLIIASAVATIKNQDKVEISNRTIGSSIIHKAHSILIFAIAYNLIAIFLLFLTEHNNEGIVSPLQVIFEQISAFSTVGLSLGITNTLSTTGKIIIITSMYVGRIGMLTLVLAISGKTIRSNYTYPEEQVMVV